MKLWRYLFLAAVLLSMDQADAFTITGETAAANRRFTSWTPSSPGPLNTNPAFLGKDYDLSGFGWNPNNNVATRPQMYALVSPIHAAHAWHYSPAQGDWRILFVNAAGEQVMTTISERLNPGLPTATFTRSDIAILRLTAPVAASSGLGIARLLDLPGSASAWGGLPAMAVGGESTGPGVALASVASINDFGVPIQSSASTTNWLNNLIVGDSGSPVTVPLGGELALIGTAASSGGPGGQHGYTVINSPGLNGAPSPSINTVLAAEGYALRWLIYDNPADPTRTAARWTGTSSSNFTANANWSSNSFPSGLPAVLDASAANSQFNLNLASAASLRGLAIRASAGSQGFTFTGAPLTLGSSGIVHRDDATLVFQNNLLVDTTQNWEGLGGDITVHGTVAGTSRAVTQVATITETGGWPAPVSVNEVQKMIWLDAPGSGTFTLTCGADTTTALPYNATAIQVATALQALPSIGSGNVSVYASDGFYQFTFINGKAATDMPQVTVALSDVTHLPLLAATSAPGRTVTLNGVVSGQLHLAANGGTLILNAANTHTGRTWVNGGTLLANNTTGSATSSGNITVRAGGLLGGTGTVAGNVTISSSGAISGLTFSAAATAAAQDKLDVGGSLALGSSSRLLLTFPSGTPQFNTAYTVLTAAGGITGTAPVVEGAMPANTAAVASISGNNLLVTFADTSAIPFTPTGFTATAPNDNSVVLRWTDNAANETGYRIQRSSDGVTFTTIQTTAANATSFTDASRPAGASATYRLVAFNAAGDSGSVTTVGGALPPGFTAGQIGTPASVGLCSYNAGVFTYSGIRSDAIAANASDNAAFLHRSVSGDGTFTARFTAAANFADWSPLGIAFRQSTANNAPHYTGVSYFDAVGGSSMNGRYNAFWRTNAGAASSTSTPYSFPAGVASLPYATYWLRVIRSGNTFTTEVSTNGSTWTTLTAATVSPTQSVTLTDPVLVGLVFSPGNTAGTDATVTVDNVSWVSTGVSAPAAPSGLAIAPASTPGQLALTWTDNANNETGFQLERSPDGNTGWTLVASPAANATSATDTGLSPATTYYYRLRALNDGGASAYSSIVSATALSAGAVVATYRNGENSYAGNQGRATSSFGGGTTVSDTYIAALGGQGRFITPIRFNNLGLTPANITSVEDISLTLKVAANTLNGAGTVALVFNNRSANSAWTEAGVTQLTINGTTQWTGPSGTLSQAASGIAPFSTTGAWDIGSGSANNGMPLMATAVVSSTNAVGSNVTFTFTGLSAAERLELIRLFAHDYAGGANTDYGVTYTANPGFFLGFSTASTYTTGDIRFHGDNDATVSNRPLLSLTYLPVAAPAAPTSLTVSPVTSSTQVSLSWTDNSANETGFEIQRSPDGTTGWTALIVTAANVTGHTDTGLAAGATWHYRVRATGAGGDSAWTSTAQGTTWTAGQAWFAAAGLNPNTPWTADSDSDGRANLVEYALGTTPNSAGSFPAIVPTRTPTGLQITFTPQVVAGLQYIIDASDTPGSWPPGDSVDVTALLVPGQPYTHFSTAPGAAKRFLRLRLIVN